MGMIESGFTGGNRVMAALVSGLCAEFGEAAGEALAQRFLEAEEADFLWEARIEERWIGEWHGGEESEDIDRIAVLGTLGGRWFTAILLVDGEGRAQGLIARRDAAGEREARVLWAASS